MIDTKLKETKIIMGMPVTLDIRDASASQETIKKIFDYFQYVDNKFSTYKDTSEISKINSGEIPWEEFSDDMKEVFSIAAHTKNETKGYFNIINPKGSYDPSGIVKGWAIYNAALMMKNMGLSDFFVDAGGDIQSSVPKQSSKRWRMGIRNPFNKDEIVKVLNVSNEGVATSGNYIRGQHIYNPFKPGKALNEVVSITVVGPNILDADRFATAAFAMGMDGINFIEHLEGFEGYQIDKNGRALMTSGFAKYLF